MSDAQKSALPMDASSIEARASAWVIDRKASDDWSSADQSELDAWLSQSLAHRIAYWRMNHAWSYTNRLAALRGAVSEQAEQSPHASSRITLPMILKIAAALIVVASLSVAATSFLSRQSYRMYSTPVGGREVVSFADGSRIELNTNTVLRARMTTDQRIVWLEKGEAYFRIKHDSTHPFIVMAEGHRVTDLGTEFLMRRGSGNLQVAVMQGRVTFDAPDTHASSQIALLTPGEVATADIATNRMRVTRMPLQELTNELGWRNGVLVFNHTTLADAATEFNRYNKRKLVIGDPAVAGLQIGGTFQANSIEAFTDVAQHILQLHVAYRGNDIVITR